MPTILITGASSGPNASMLNAIRMVSLFAALTAEAIRLVAPVGRPVLRAIVGIYRALLDEIARRDYYVLAGRIALPAWRKAAITLGALASSSL